MERLLHTIDGVAPGAARFNHNNSENRSRQWTLNYVLTRVERVKTKPETGGVITADSDNITISVAWEQVSFFQFTIEINDQMTHEEHRRFVEALRSAGGDRNGDHGYFGDPHSSQATGMSWKTK